MKNTQHTFPQLRVFKLFVFFTPANPKISLHLRGLNQQMFGISASYIIKIFMKSILILIQFMVRISSAIAFQCVYILQLPLYIEVRDAQCIYQADKLSFYIIGYRTITELQPIKKPIIQSQITFIDLTVGSDMHL